MNAYFILATGLVVVSLLFMLISGNGSKRGWPAFLTLGGCIFAYIWNGFKGVGLMFLIIFAELILLRIIVQHTKKRNFQAKMNDIHQK